MKIAEELARKLLIIPWPPSPEDSKRLDEALEILKPALLDAWKQGMTEAATLIVGTDVDKAPPGFEKAAAVEILMARDAKKELP